MSKRFELINFLNAHDNFKDNKKNEKLDGFDVVRLLNHYDELQTLLVEKDQRIAELEEQLKNVIVPKFKPHNDLFVIVGYKDEPKSIEQYYIDEIVIRGNGKLVEYRDIEQETIIGENNLLFATKEEAQAKLEELGGNDVKD